MSEKITRDYLKTLNFEQVMQIWKDMHNAPRTCYEYAIMACSPEHDLVAERLEELRKGGLC